MKMGKPLGLQQRSIRRYQQAAMLETTDQLIVEEALEIRVLHRGRQHQLAITMRTPGEDDQLALGFLFSEAIIQSFAEVEGWEMLDEQVILIRLTAQSGFKAAHFQRNTFVSSSCGVCGKAALDQLQTHSQYLPWSAKTVFKPDNICELPQRIRSKQLHFEKTGGNHSVAVCNAAGEIVHLSEDVGRHNAMDKVIGWALQNGQLPLSKCMLLLSGRASFELVQKGMMAGLPLMAAIGAPSSAAVELADASGMTLIGFLKKYSANVYCHDYRLG